MTPERLAELDAVMAKATAFTGEWIVKASDGKPIIASAGHGGNLFRGYIATWEQADAIVALHNAYPLLTAHIDAQAAEIARLREALAKSEDAMREMFRYYDGGETRGSYDGKPERAQLRTAWRIARAALASTGAA